MAMAVFTAKAQEKVLAPTPPMGFMTWNYFGVDFTENDIKTMADAMVANGLVELGYNYMCIDDGWQGGRDTKNNIIADPKKFPSGVKALADYLHQRGIKLGMYSDASPLTCAGYTASLHFEEQDAKTFADWGVDYLKYDYCGAPSDAETAKNRYKKMANALRKTGRDIVFAICEWGDRFPWEWASQSGGQLWRTTADVRDKWASYAPTNQDLHREGAGIFDIFNANASLSNYAKSGAWNDPDMLVVGLYGKKGPSGDLGGKGCTDVEYQSQMSLWCLMSAPLMITCDIRTMNEKTKEILTNKDIIAIDQDKLGKQAKRVVHKNDWHILLKPLANSDYAIGILNASSETRTYELDLKTIGLDKKYNTYNVWTKERKEDVDLIKVNVQSHETVVFRLSK
ncbi:MAG: glycoside hydrolase family 27 protein [Flavobacteriaceae bacterium]|nr:glycoside hydrolase family 27 protein [Flavobacteriaceae bacterium]